MNVPSIFAIILVMYGFLRPGNFLIYLAFAFLAFGSFSIIPSQLTGGTTILASYLSFLLVFVRLAITPAGSRQALNIAFDFNRLGMLLLFTLVAVAGAVVLPRVLQGQVEVFPMRPQRQTMAMYAVPLAPTGANFNQAANIIVSFVVAVAFAVMARFGRSTVPFRNALLWGGGAVVLTGLADLISPYVGLGPVLATFRTASYSFLLDSEIMGVKRIIGLMPEASSFGSLAVAIGGLLLFCRNAYPSPIRHQFAIPLAIACLLFAAISTSSTAYVALFGVFMLHLGDIFLRIFTIRSRRDQNRLIGEIATLLGLLMIGVCVFTVWDDGRTFIWKMVDASVFQKTKSLSYIERSSWTNVALQAFIDSNGLGVGLGAVRTSNLFINILASTGVAGAVAFLIFQLQVFLAAVDERDPSAVELVRGAKFGLVTIFITGVLAGTTPDYGVLAASLFGTIMGFSQIRIVTRGRRPSHPGAEPLSVSAQRG